MYCAVYIFFFYTFLLTKTYFNLQFNIPGWGKCSVMIYNLSGMCILMTQWTFSTHKVKMLDMSSLCPFYSQWFQIKVMSFLSWTYWSLGCVYLMGPPVLASEYMIQQYFRCRRWVLGWFPVALPSWQILWQILIHMSIHWHSQMGIL